MDILISVLSAVMAAIALALALANVANVVGAVTHTSETVSRVLSHFSRVFLMFRLSDSALPERPRRRIEH